MDFTLTSGFQATIFSSTTGRKTPFESSCISTTSFSARSNCTSFFIEVNAGQSGIFMAAQAGFTAAAITADVPGVTAHYGRRRTAAAAATAAAPSGII